MSYAARLVILAVAVLLVGPRSAPAQKKKIDPEAEKAAHLKRLLDDAEDEYRRFFKKPEKALDFWAAMRAEMDVGKFELAALHLKYFLDPPAELKIEAKDIDEVLFNVEQADGMFAFLRLRHVKKWSNFMPFQRETEKNVNTLIERATAVVDKKLDDPVRIKKFIKNLEAKTVEERTFAFMQLKRSKERVTPHLIETLRTTVGSTLNLRVREAMVSLDADIVPPFLEVLKASDEKDAASVELRMTLLDIVRRRADKRAIPYLWHMSEWTKYPLEIRTKAKAVLAALLETAPERLPPAKVALVDLAERYYQHRVKFVDPNRIRLWIWNGQAITVPDPPHLTTSQAEEYYGMRYAAEALTLDPSYQPAQMVFLNMTLDRTLGPKMKDLLFEKLQPNMHRLLTTIDIDLLLAVLDRALQERNMPIALTIIQTLGERGELKAARDPGNGPPSGIVKGLYDPDRRLQYTSMVAMLKMPKRQTPVAASRIVELLSRFTASEPVPKALLAYFPAAEIVAARKVIKDAGFEPEAAGPMQVPRGPVDINATFKLLNPSADFDAIIIHHAAGAELPHALSRLRADPNHGLLPILVIAPKGKEEAFVRMAERFRNVQIISELQAKLPERIKEFIEVGTKVYSGLPLQEKERKLFTIVSMNELWRMARGEVTGYDTRPALETVKKLALSDEFGVQAIEILGRTPGVEIQQRLASIVLDPARGKLRVTAAIELNRHLQKNGISLTRQQVSDIRKAHLDQREMPEVRAQLTVTVAHFRTTPATTGNKLLDFEADPPPVQKK
jgi:hypothetical protein